MTKIAIDIDGVLADLQIVMFKWHNLTYGTDISPEKIISYDLSVSFQCSKEESWKRVDEFFNSSYINLIAPIEGSVKAVKRLKKKHELYVVTSRSLNLQEHTITWIAKHFGNAFQQIVFSHNGKNKTYHSKSELCTKLGVTIIVEDCLEYANECAKAGIDSLLFDLNGTYGWNKNGKVHQLVERVYSWKEIEMYADILS